MSIRGWVYVITNDSLKGLVKIGYTLKDPTLRSKELRSSGIPHSYNLAYEILTINPRDVEQKTHSILKEYRENKEWFRCSISQAVSTIKSIVNENKLYEKFYDEKCNLTLHDFSSHHGDTKARISSLETYLKRENDPVFKEQERIKQEIQEKERRKHISLEDWMKGKR